MFHSLGKYWSTTARASLSSSELNDEATHENRLSQLKPPLIHAFLKRPHISNRAAEEEPPRTSMPRTIAGFGDDGRFVPRYQAPSPTGRATRAPSATSNTSRKCANGRA